MTPFFAILLDAYRELNARKLFWLALIISALVVLLGSAVGVSPAGYTFFGHLFYQTPDVESPRIFYRRIFLEDGIGWWLTDFAVILALVSTASIYPDFLAGGSIDLFLSKPVSRLNLFLMKFVTGLLFVALQVLVFCVASFLVMGIRGGDWEWKIFLAVPIVVLMFSYLFSVSAFLGTWSRSTILTLLLVVPFWAINSLTDKAKQQLAVTEIVGQQQIPALDRQIDRLQKLLESLPPTTAPATPAPQPVSPRPLFRLQMGQTPQSREVVNAELTEAQGERQAVGRMDDIFGTLLTWLNRCTFFLPQTGQTISLLNRDLISIDDLVGADSRSEQDNSNDPMQAFNDSQLRDRLIEGLLRQRSASSIVGTSLVFEVSMLATAAWIFCRRDY
jgi:hypothetical protein